MSKYVLITDSGADLFGGLDQRLGIETIPMTFTIEDKEYNGYFDERDITNRKFYELLESGKVAKTSMINADRFVTTFTPFLEQGLDILYFSLSSTLSGTYQSSVLAREELLEKYPNAKIICVDSLSASLGQGLLLYHASALRSAGKSIEEVATYLEANRLFVNHLFTVAELDTLKRGGRLSKTSAAIGSLLGIKPVLHVDETGKLVALKKARGRKNALKVLIDSVVTNIKNPGDQTMFISHSDDLATAEAVAKEIKTLVNVKDVQIGEIGPVIGAHAGKGTIAVFFFADKR